MGLAMSKCEPRDCQEEQSEALIRRLGQILGDQSAVRALSDSKKITVLALSALTALAEQAVRMGIDYHSLGSSWDHPRSRTAYRLGVHSSTMAPSSRGRAERSRLRLLALAARVASGGVRAEQGISRAFVAELGLRDAQDPPASFAAVEAALASELLLPLRALNECDLSRSTGGNALPKERLQAVVRELTEAVLTHPGGFCEWRYGGDKGREQLRGLSAAQVEAWRDPLEIRHGGGLRTHEDGPGELGFFWATKIGGPSHGFDYEPQCVLPLLGNARNKALLLSDPKWPQHPAGRAHWRLLWSVGPLDQPLETEEPRLWLEAMNVDFDARGLSTEFWTMAALTHCLVKTCTMGVQLSVAQQLAGVLGRAAERLGLEGDVVLVSERLVLRPSQALVEASDFLSAEHDWLQEEREVTQEIPRALYRPSAADAPTEMVAEAAMVHG